MRERDVIKKSISEKRKQEDEEQKRGEREKRIR